MQITRREFGGHLVRGAAVMTLASTTFGLGGCGLAQDIQDWVGVGLAAFNSILTELAANGIKISPAVSAIATDVQAALTAIDAAAMEYAATTPPPATAIAKLQAALKAATDQLALFLQSVTIPGAGLISLIANIAGVILSAIAGFLNKIPPAPAPTPAPAATFTVASSYRMASGQNVVVTPMHISSLPGKFNHDFRSKVNNSLNEAKKQGVVVIKAAYL